MLTLSRKVKETICIGEDIRVTVTRVKGGDISLQIIAPRSVPVHRKETYDIIKARDGVVTPGGNLRPKAPKPKSVGA